jgi:hypothetical protein
LGREAKARVKHGPTIPFEAQVQHGPSDQAGLPFGHGADHFGPGIAPADQHERADEEEQIELFRCVGR